MADFLAMGGHGAYVWPAYALSLSVLIGLAWRRWKSLRALRARSASIEASEPKNKELD